ncbi:MAG: hypothetical protein HQL03_05180 [Nitrospirae bacterium]|nr:hypothetical protein [Nitrospirota bacterium]MBF0592308.1 hypothetical protein [Nitrospirota bacterium]
MDKVIISAQTDNACSNATGICTVDIPSNGYMTTKMPSKVSRQGWKTLKQVG